MKINKVSFSRLKSFGTFENVKIGAEAEVADGEKAEEVLSSLKAWVEERIAEEVSKPREEWYTSRLKELEKKVEELEKKRDELNATIRKLLRAEEFTRILLGEEI